MKLIEEDGTVIDEIDDNATLLVFEAGMPKPTLITPKMDDRVPVPNHILLAGALIAFLDHPYNRKAVMDHLPHANKDRRN